jgi:hypothetical protein
VAQAAYAYLHRLTYGVCAKILARVRQYERETKQDSIMDAIGSGTLDLAALIKEALGEVP